MKQAVLSLAGFFILFAIILGAFGAHSLKNHLNTEELNSLQTGIQYQLFHGLSLIVLGLNFDRIKKANLMIMGIVFGTILFYLIFLKRIWHISRYYPEISVAISLVCILSGNVVTLNLHPYTFIISSFMISYYYSLPKFQK